MIVDVPLDRRIVEIERDVRELVVELTPFRPA